MVCLEFDCCKGKILFCCDIFCLDCFVLCVCYDGGLEYKI